MPRRDSRPGRKLWRPRKTTKKKSRPGRFKRPLPAWVLGLFLMNILIGCKGATQRKLIKRRFSYIKVLWSPSEISRWLKLVQKSLSPTCSPDPQTPTITSTAKISAPSLNGLLRGHSLTRIPASILVRCPISGRVNKFPHKKKLLSSFLRAGNSVRFLLPFIAWSDESTKSTGFDGTTSTSSGGKSSSGPGRGMVLTGRRSNH